MTCKLSDREQVVYDYIVDNNLSFSDDDTIYKKLKGIDLNHDEINNVKKAIEAYNAEIRKEHLR